VQNGGDFSGFGIIFNMKMMVDSVHGSWTTRGSVHHGPLGGVDQRPPEQGSMLAGVQSRTAPELGSSPARVCFMIVMGSWCLTTNHDDIKECDAPESNKIVAGCELARNIPNTTS
jgi:hypothetical protein